MESFYQIHKYEVLLSKENVVNSHMLLTNLLVKPHIYHSCLDILYAFQSWRIDSVKHYDLSEIRTDI